MKTSQYPLWSEKEERLLRKVYPFSGAEELSKYFPDRTSRAIYARAQHLDIKKEDVGLIRRNGNATLLLSPSLESFYWIGYIFADGHITYKKRLTVHSKDAKHLEKMACYLNTGIRIVNHPGNLNYGIGPTTLHVLSISQPEIIKEISKKWNINQNKTENAPEISFLKKNLENNDNFIAFLLGFVDGDGCISINKKGYSYLIIENHANWLPVHLFFVDRLTSMSIYKGISTETFKTRILQNTTEWRAEAAR